MNFIDIITERGFVHQMTDEAGLRDLLKTPGQTAYIGFDCTAKSLHVGSLMQIMLLRWWQKCGHRPIVLLGGGTTKIGDPSGKDESRPPLTDAQIQENMESLKTVFGKFLTFSNNESTTPQSSALMVNNDNWLSGLEYIEFLRDYGRFFSINQMLTKDSVKLRLERNQHLSFIEFNYMILQSFDFLKLNETYGCRIQMGGSDQWGNITEGLYLHHRVNTRKNFGKLGGISIEVTGLSEEESKQKSTKALDAMYDNNYEKEKIFGITSPLLTTASGAKMGKTAAGAVWLNADLLSPYDYWQFWRNTEDADVIKFLKLFTEIELAQIAEYETWVGSSKINDAKIILATEATTLLHGRAEAEKARATAAETFAGSGMSENLPTVEILRSEVEAGANLIRWMLKAEFASSNGEARRLIEGNGISVNDVKITDVNHRLSPVDFANGFAKLSKGKKHHVRVVIG